MMHWQSLARRRPAEAARRLAILSTLAMLGALGAIAPAFADDRPDGAELATAFGMLVVIMIAFAAAGLGMVWAHRNGEFQEPEEAKYQMLAMVEDEVDFWDMGSHDDEEDDDILDMPTGVPRLTTPFAE